MSDQAHTIRLSIDLYAVKDFKVSANLLLKYNLKLGQKFHSFKSQAATPVNSGPQEQKLSQGFANYEFQASKGQLHDILAGNNDFIVEILHSEQGAAGGISEREMGRVSLSLKNLLGAPLKETPQAMVRVSDQYLPISNQVGQPKGTLRLLMYLEDMGLVSQQAANPDSKLTALHSSGVVSGGGQGEQAQGSPDYQIVWELEMWKRSEQAKFKVHLKEQEIQRIEQVTIEWRKKESEREEKFTEACKRVQTLESKIRQKATDLDRREEKLVHLEDELRQKIIEVSRQLTGKEEEIMNIKKKFKEEKQIMDVDKRRLQKEVGDYQAKLESAHSRFFGLKKEVEESPLSVLRQELGQKNLTILELESKVKQTNNGRDEYQTRYENIKRDMVLLKKQIDKDKEGQLLKQAEELEQLKNMMRNKQAQDEERREIESLRNQLQTINQRGTMPQNSQANMNSDVTNMKKESCHRPQRSVLAQPDRNIYIDDFARQQRSPIKETLRAGASSGGCQWERLLTEKQDLLQSGCYTEDDVLIREIDRQISDAKQKQGAQ